jgi:two-component system, chemotaxis family, sensor kinase CheA
VASMKTLLAGESLQGGETVTSPEEKNEAHDFMPLDFALNSSEITQVSDAFSLGHGVYQIDITLEPNTMMKAVRAVMATQRFEGIGTVIKLLPSIEELEAGKAESFSLLVLCDEPINEIQRELLEISELKEVVVHPYSESAVTVNDKQVEEPVKGSGSGSSSEEKTNDSAEVIKTEPLLTSSKTIGATSSPSPAPSAAAIKTTPPSPEVPAGEVNTQVHTIRVDTARMDNLINLVGEMVITRTRLVQIGLDLKAQYQMDSMVNSLNEANVYLGRLMNDLQESVMRLRMVAIGTVFSRFPRLVRDLAKKTGKEIDLVLKGEDTELDKTVVEVIGDPLMHLIRNSVDHGIEPPEVRRAKGKPEVGTVTLDAYHEGNHIAILITDDGAGLDLDKIRTIAVSKGLISEREDLSEREIANLIFLPGFSTADKVTDISGRGVGMDVVKKALNNLGGMVDITTFPGKGTTFTIRLPLTLAIIQALLVEVGEEIYAVPLSSVLETLLVNRADIKTVGGLPMVQLRGNTLPLISLQEKFGLPTPETLSD